ncbi:calcium homeostasis modulator protein 2-like [Gadus chalcogrammus]|uniref:calcium homeostasis modulator protein 2-like n=1 Tax=Gadus chalcogrammus TaxID=1042646 RepID=UPI0024C4DBF7|nr:calcium homeostasis modulator protein 2-like [Gadus chalcogrammus]
MAAAALVTENFKFVSLFFKSKDVMIFNGLIALGTVASQTAYNVFAFSCPCSPERNHRYGLAAIGVPALVFFLLGVMMNRSTWDLLSECRLRRCRRLAAVSVFAVTGNILGRAAIAPVTWVVISLLQGEAYLCALSEFVDPDTLEEFPKEGRNVIQLMAKFPCRGTVPSELLPFWEEIERRLKYESQLLGWLIVAAMAVVVFLMLCAKRCCSPFGSQQEEYWSRFHASEQDLFKRTAAVHANLVAAENVKSFFGFVALDDEEKAQVEEHAGASTPVQSEDWNRVAGVYLYRENGGVPLYSRLHKWARYHVDNNTEGMEKLS